MFDIFNSPLGIFFITFIISFIGSSQPSMVNLMASRLVITHGIRHALMYSIAASMAELIYSFLAAYYIGKIHLDPKHQMMATLITGLVLIIFGIYMLYNPPKVELKKTRFDHPILKGWFLSLSNPQLPLFWCGMVMVYNEYGIVVSDHNFKIGAFTLAAALGDFILLIVYVKVTEYYVKDLDERKINFLNKISAYLLLCIGLFAVFRIFI